MSDSIYCEQHNLVKTLNIESDTYYCPGCKNLNNMKQLTPAELVGILEVFKNKSKGNNQTNDNS